MVVITVAEAGMALAIGKVQPVPNWAGWLFVPLLVVLAVANTARERGAVPEGATPDHAGKTQVARWTTGAVRALLLVLVVGQIVTVTLVLRSRYPYGSCTFGAEAAGVALPYPSVTNEQQLRFCPVLVNGGKPVTGPFALEGDVLGPAQDRQQIALVSLADRATCDTLGNHGTGGYFFFPSSQFGQRRGHWHIQEKLGYDESVTITRTYVFVQGSQEALARMATDRDDWNAAGHDPAKYPGMPVLPPDSKPVARFVVSGGTYHGKHGMCSTPK